MVIYIYIYIKKLIGKKVKLKLKIKIKLIIKLKIKLKIKLMIKLIIKIMLNQMGPILNNNSILFLIFVCLTILLEKWRLNINLNLTSIRELACLDYLRKI